MVVLRDIEELSYEEICEITGLPEGTVKSRLHRARLALKERLERERALMEGSSEAEASTPATQGGFSAYLDGELPDAERRVVDEHLAVCIQCRTELTRLKATAAAAGRPARAGAADRSWRTSRSRSTRARAGRFFGRRRLLFGRIPFEWVSLAMIVAMLVYYIVTQHASPTQVAPGPVIPG